jgi:hypothetical protein
VCERERVKERREGGRGRECLRVLVPGKSTDNSRLNET